MTRPQVLIALFLILLLTFTAFSPCIENGFVNWDDNTYVTQNPLIKELSPATVKSIFTSLHQNNYHPLALLSYALEYRFFRLDPFAYHATNLALHLLNALLVFWLVFLLGKNIPVSFLAAVLFGIHPLRVESVAWIAERRDVLYAFFFLGSLIQYLYYRKNKAARYYYFSLLLFILAVLSKVMAITLPAVLLLCDYLLGRKLDKNNLKEKIPFFAALVVPAAVTIISRYHSGYMRLEYALQFFYGICVASHALFFYLAKTIAPVKLSIAYSYTMSAPTVLPWRFLISPAVVLALAALIAFSARRTKKIVFGSLFFFIAVSPTLQILFSDISPAAADRYTYVPLIGIFYILAEAFFWLYKRMAKFIWVRLLLVAILASALAVLISLTQQRCRVWKDSISLWSDALKNYPNFVTGYNNLGSAYNNAGEYEKAIPILQKAIEMDPRMGHAYFNLANSYKALGRRQEALQLYTKAAELDPSLKEKK